MYFLCIHCIWIQITPALLLPSLDIFLSKNTFKQTHHVAGFALTSQVDQLCHKFAMHSFPNYIPQHVFSVLHLFGIQKLQLSPRTPGIHQKTPEKGDHQRIMARTRDQSTQGDESTKIKATWKSAVEVIFVPENYWLSLKKGPFYKGNVVFQTIIFQGRVVSFRRSIVNLFLLMRRYDSDGSVGAKQGFWELRILAYNVGFEMK